MNDIIDLTDYIPKEDIPVNWRLKKILKEIREFNEKNKK